MTDPLLVEVIISAPISPVEVVTRETLVVEFDSIQSPIEVIFPAETILVETLSAPEMIVIEVGVPGPPGPLAGESMPYAKRTDSIGENLIYKGEAVPGSAEAAAVWRISRLSIIDDDITEKWANGNAEFINGWTERASLDYR